MIEKDLKKYEQVKEVFYQKSMVHFINENVRKISFVILGFCLILFIIAISLINNTIRLSIYSKRFLINTMKLVGATKSFIRKPFLYKSVLHGIYCTGIALALLLFFLHWAEKQLQDIVKLTELDTIVILCSILLVVGIFINVLSTWFAVNKFLKIRSDDLYY
jgi:cell division transport system permease protein